MVLPFNECRNHGFTEVGNSNVIHFNTARTITAVPEKKLKKDGTPKTISKNKKKGKKSEVYHFEIEDMKKMSNYFKENEKWLPYLIFVLSCNMARRVGDTLTLTWGHFFNTNTGEIRDFLEEIVEDKTDKLANPKINSACKAAIKLYLEKTGCDPSLENYRLPICMQLTGTYKGRVLTYSGYYKAVKKAAAEIGIGYNVGTHSPRKTFGMINRMIHPNDYDSMEILQLMFNHSDSATTRHYIGLTKKKIDSYYDDMGRFFDDYITGDKEYLSVSNSPVISLDTNDFRDILKAAYESGRLNANVDDAAEHLEAFSRLMELADQFMK